MTRYAALLRGISPSGNNMTNDKLRGVFEGLGLGDVASVLSSGNLVFSSDQNDAAALEQQLEDALAGRLGLSSRVILRTDAELATLLAGDPFQGLSHGRGSYLTATFLKGPAAPGPVDDQPDPLTRVVGYDLPSRAVLAVTDNSDPGRTPDFMAWLEKQYGTDITTRTWLTVQRIARKLAA